MKKLFFMILMLFIISKVNACPQPPFSTVANNPDRFLQKSDVAFLGKLVLINEPEKDAQFAEFLIKKIFKGTLIKKVTIINKYRTSRCSRPFVSMGSNYYVFANFGETKRELIIDGFASFARECGFKSTYETTINSLTIKKPWRFLTKAFNQPKPR